MRLIINTDIRIIGYFRIRLLNVNSLDSFDFWILSLESSLKSNFF